MQQLDFFSDIPAKHWKAEHGATWQAGHYACRNWHGFFQSREGVKGKWRFQISAFRDDDMALVYVISDDGSLADIEVPIDDANRITVRGRKYCRAHWDH